MAKLFGEYVSEKEYEAFGLLLDFTREKKCQISVEMATKKHNEDSSFPTINSFACCAAFSDFSDAARKAYAMYQRELPDDEEEESATEVKTEAIIEPPAEATTETEPSPEEEPQDEPEPPSEEEPQDEPEPPSEEEPQDDPESSPEKTPREDYDPSDTECDPFDEGPDSILEAGLPVHELNAPDNGEGSSEPEEDEDDDSTVKVYVNDKRSQIVLPPTVSLVNYLFNCLVRVPDLGFKNEYFYAEDTGFYAEASEPDNKITETKYFAGSSIEDSCNLFVVKRPNPPILEIVSQEYDEQIRIPFPGPRKDICYIVSKPFAEAARAAGRTTDDLIYIEDYERITGTKYNEILVKEFRGL